MKTTLIILFFCFFFNLALGGDSIVSFHESKITLPQGFKEQSKEQLRTFKATIFDRQIMSVFENKNDGLHRILVYYDSLSGTKNLKFEKIVEIKLEVIKESGILLEDVKIDEPNYCVYGKTIIHGDTSIFGFSIDEFGIMGVHFDNSKGIGNKDYKSFEKLITTINHNSPYKYVPKENPEVKEAKKEMERHGLNFTIALAVMIIFWIIRKYAINNK